MHGTCVTYKLKYNAPEADARVDRTRSGANGSFVRAPSSARTFRKLERACGVARVARSAEIFFGIFRGALFSPVNSRGLSG